MRIVENEQSSGQEPGIRRELDAASLGRALRQRKAWIIAPALVCLIGSAIGVNMVKPRYTAEAKILLENQESFFTRPDRSDVVSQAPLPDDEAVQSQVQLVSSRDIARKAIRQLDLQGNPEFDPAATGLGPISRLMVLLGFSRDPLSTGAEERMLTAYYDRLTVFPVARSRVLTVQFTAQDPDIAAKAANTVSDLYIGLQSEAKRASAKAAADSLAALIADLKVKVAAADTRAQEFRASNGLLVGTNNTTITSQSLSDLTTQLSQARTAEAEAQAKAKLLRDMIKQNRIGDVPDVANSDLIRRISEQRIALKGQIAQQSITLLPSHPRMRELNAQLADLDAQLRTAGDKVVRALENDSHIAADRVANLKATLDGQKVTATTAGTDQVRLNELEQQARLLRDQLDFSTQKYQEALARENAISTPADARVISRAAAPELPSFPKKGPMIAIFTLAGLVLSIGVVLARELVSGRAFVPETVPAAPPVPVTVPMPVVAERPVVEPARPTLPYAGYDPDASDADLVTMLDMVADHQKDGGGVRLLVLCTADAALTGPDSVMTLSRALARRSRVVLVDCGTGLDLDQLLSMPRSSEMPPVRGLVNLLAGDTSFAEVIHRDPMSRLHIVPFGTGEAIDVEQGLGLLVDALSETYDHVVLAVPAADAAGMIRGATQGDLAILCVTVATTPEVIEADRAALHRAGVPSVYVLDIAELGIVADQQGTAAAAAA